MNPIWPTVDQASVRLTLTCDHIASIPSTAVDEPTTVNSMSAAGDCTITGASRSSNAPPALMIPACMSAETGVGASIVSGSQLWNGNCADLVNAAVAVRTATHVKAGPWESPASTARSRNTPRSSVRQLIQISAIAPINAASPSRLIKNFLRAGGNASGRSA